MRLFTILKRHRWSAAALPILTAASMYAAQPNLPIVIVLGKQYYCYEAKKGDSLFGIANHFGWDSALLNELNSNAGSPVAKGTLIYYPVSDDTQTRDEGNKNMTSEKVTHLIQPGETIYSISRAYGLPMEELYALNPSARSGIRAGDTLTISEPRVITVEEKEPEDTMENESEESLKEGNEYVYHTVASGETLYNIAIKYDTRVEDLYRLNPGITPEILMAGETLRVSPGTRSNNVHYETVTEQSIVSIDNYKVKKGDTWASVSASLGVDQEALRDANPGKWKLKKGDILMVPHTKEVEVEQSYVEIDPREQTSEGLRELYDEVHSIDTTISGGISPAKEVKVAIVLDDTASNRDMEFARGALLGVEHLKNADFKSNVMILDGAANMSVTLTKLETFGPDLIISTSDKSLPQYLTEYSQRTGAELINSFDVKSEAYIDTPTVYQFLTPSSYFNESVVEYVKDRLGDRTLLTVGNVGGGDALGDMIVKSFGNGVKNITTSELENFKPAEFGKYLIYCADTRQKDVETLMEKVAEFQTANPLVDIKVFGRANWVTFGAKLSEKYADVDFLVPSRFYFDPNDIESRRFINEYQVLYGQTPIKSFPVYSVAGYDIISYFLPNISAARGDFNARFKNAETLQSNIEIERVSNWSGMYNPSCFILDYSFSSSPMKIALPISR